MSLTVEFRKKGEWTTTTVWNIQFRDTGEVYEGSGYVKLPRTIYAVTSKPKKVKLLLEKFDCKDHNLIIDYDSFVGNDITLYVTHEGLRRLGIKVETKERAERKVKVLDVEHYKVKELYFNGRKVGERWELIREDRELELVGTVGEIYIPRESPWEAERKVLVRNKENIDVREEVEIVLFPDGEVRVHVPTTYDEEWKRRILSLPGIEEVIKELKEKLQEAFEEWKKKVEEVFGVDVKDARTVSEVEGRVVKAYPHLTDDLVERILDGQFPNWRELHRKVEEKGEKYYMDLIEVVDGDEDTTVYEVSPQATEEDVEVIKFLLIQGLAYCDEVEGEDGKRLLVAGV
jgi:molybdopterin converting factor small subunit